MHTPSQILPGIWCLPVPIHVRSQPVNCWILRDDDGSLVIFDTGIDAGARDRWPAALAAIDANVRDVSRVIVSHHHPDHVGGSGALHELTGVAVEASAAAIALSPIVWGDGGRMERYFAELTDLLAANGFPAAIAHELEHEAALAKLAVQLPPDDAWQELALDAEVEVGGRRWRVIPASGHVDGQIVLHEERDGLLLSADHVLERTSPAVGRFPQHSIDPLADYFESLQRVAALDVRMVLPGHGAPFAHARERAHQLISHHEERVEQCIAALPRSGATAYEVARTVFARVFEATEVDAANQRFATTESLAHLEWAVGAGRAETGVDDAGVTRFFARGA